MTRLAALHEKAVCLPPEAVAATAQRLGVSADSVSRRFAELARRREHRSRPCVDPIVLAEAARQVDFAAAARHLRAHGVDLASPVIERLLEVAPGPDARRLRGREAARRLALAEMQIRDAA